MIANAFQSEPIVSASFEIRNILVDGHADDNGASGRQGMADGRIRF
jgi:hypothetical protein